MRGEDACNLAVAAIPAQHRLTHQILNHWLPFQDLKQALAVSRRAEELRLRSQQRIIATAEDSVLGIEMAKPRVSGRGYPQTYPLVQADELAEASQASLQR